MKNNTVFVSLLSVSVGLLVGYVLWGATSHNMDMSMDSQMHTMSNSLKGKTGDEFDKAFLSEMVIHHEGAVIMAEDVLATSKRPELLTLAKDIISAQTKEINQMKAWYKKWYGVELTK